VRPVAPLNEGWLAYREQERLRLLSGTELEAEREYVFGRRDGGFDVLFKEQPPRLFHTISLSASSAGELSGSAEALYECRRSPREKFAMGTLVSSEWTRDVLSGQLWLFFTSTHRAGKAE
jgi:hypothetical protein